MSTFAVAGGGTGGHVTLTLALAEEVAARGHAVLVLGSAHGLERELVPRAGFELVTFGARQVMGQRLPARLRALAGLAVASRSARRVLRRRGVDVVISVGGYAAVPAMAGAALARIPTALVEPNAIPGRANRLMVRFARHVFVGFDEAAGYLPVPPGRVTCTGIPLRRALAAAFASADAVRKAPVDRPLHLLVAGGSQGARQLNEAMMEAAPQLDPGRFEVFHQSGAADRERVAAAYRAAGLRAKVVAFTDDMPGRYRWADLALCRAGALTVAELALARLPALFVPYPFAADDHQAANARALAAVGGARVLASRPLVTRDVVEALRELAAEPARLEAMGRALSDRGRPDAARAIVDACTPWVRRRGGGG